jgi:hypothetical protein
MIIQIELPPYHVSRSPLDLIVVEIIFGRLFEAFRHVSQDASTGTSTDADIPLQKMVAQMARLI